MRKLDAIHNHDHLQRVALHLLFNRATAHTDNQDQ